MSSPVSLGDVHNLRALDALVIRTAHADRPRAQAAVEVHGLRHLLVQQALRRRREGGREGGHRAGQAAGDATNLLLRGHTRGLPLQGSDLPPAQLLIRRQHRQNPALLCAGCPQEHRLGAAVERDPFPAALQAHPHGILARPARRMWTQQREVYTLAPQQRQQPLKSPRPRRLQLSLDVIRNTLGRCPRRLRGKRGSRGRGNRGAHKSGSWGGTRVVAKGTSQFVRYARGRSLGQGLGSRGRHQDVVGLLLRRLLRLGRPRPRLGGPRLGGRRRCGRGAVRRATVLDERKQEVFDRIHVGCFLRHEMPTWMGVHSRVLKVPSQSFASPTWDVVVRQAPDVQGGHRQGCLRRVRLNATRHRPPKSRDQHREARGGRASPVQLAAEGSSQNSSLGEAQDAVVASARPLREHRLEALPEAQRLEVGDLQKLLGESLNGLAATIPQLRWIHPPTPQRRIVGQCVRSIQSLQHQDVTQLSGDLLDTLLHEHRGILTEAVQSKNTQRHEFQSASPRPAPYRMHAKPAWPTK
mmetsp:Transcript_93940/g.302195  ORF Transcript_93940/g.302195 Transcript_93940/m.302195 type:complete len:525 (+) Transcript_93940:1-1575(+)